MRVDKTIENIKDCLCLKCPSYTSFCKNHRDADEIVDDGNEVSQKKHLEILFCASRKSNCIHENLGCLCLKCPVHKRYELNNEDYCLTNGGVL